jgi:hypothetical protein
VSNTLEVYLTLILGLRCSNWVKASIRRDPPKTNDFSGEYTNVKSWGKGTKSGLPPRGREETAFQGWGFHEAQGMRRFTKAE